jgi:GAF domain-containing protein
MTEHSLDPASHPSPAEPRLARLRRQFRLLSTSNRTLNSNDKEHQLLTNICGALAAVGGYRLAWIGCSSALAGAASEPTVSAAWDNGELDPSQVGWTHARGPTPALEAMRERAPQIVGDIEDERWSAAWREQARQAGLRAALAMPLVADDHCLGVLEVYKDRPAVFAVPEVAMIQELAADLVLGIAALRTRRECQRQKADIARLTRVLKMQSAINSAVLRIRDRKLLLQEACRIAVDVGHYTGAVVWAVEPGARYARPGFYAGTANALCCAGPAAHRRRRRTRYEPDGPRHAYRGSHRLLRSHAQRARRWSDANCYMRMACARWWPCRST